MTAIEYAKQFDNYPTYHKIAIDAFNAGKQNAKPANVEKLERELKQAKQELKDLLDTINDPEKLGEFLGGL